MEKAQTSDFHKHKNLNDICILLNYKKNQQKLNQKLNKTSFPSFNIWVWFLQIYFFFCHSLDERAFTAFLIPPLNLSHTNVNVISKFS